MFGSFGWHSDFFFPILKLNYEVALLLGVAVVENINLIIRQAQ